MRNNRSNKDVYSDIAEGMQQLIGYDPDKQQSKEPFIIIRYYILGCVQLQSLLCPSPTPLRTPEAVNPALTAERLCRIRKRPRRTKEDFLLEVMMHSDAKKQELNEWQDSEKRDRKKNMAHQKEATEQLLNVMECQADTLQSSTADSHYPLHSTPIPLKFGPAEVQYPLHCTPKEKEPGLKEEKTDCRAALGPLVKAEASTPTVLLLVPPVE
ncbi:hypothetical protein UY3_04809 [Chelonia mydas]|uniref:Uncharacterized protein n=1 Tax=Chelonia mydas TaxID=8469 RepID=M7BQQ9_CHEMY|nr:hypothetical protein UY3_04809 [Chelonia mydas]